MSTDSPKAELSASVKRYAWYLMFMAGLGGLLYGIDVGVIAAALPYIEKTSTYTLGQLSGVVMAVLLGSVISSLFAGMLAEWLGRKKVIIISALLFTLSIPVICLSDNVYAMLMAGRLLQGASAGLVGVVVPMYLAECLDAQSRGKGTGMFQFLLTVGLVFASVVGIVTTAGERRHGRDGFPGRQGYCVADDFLVLRAAGSYPVPGCVQAEGIPALAVPPRS